MTIIFLGNALDFGYTNNRMIKHAVVTWNTEYGYVGGYCEKRKEKRERRKVKKKRKEMNKRMRERVPKTSIP